MGVKLILGVDKKNELSHKVTLNKERLEAKCSTIWPICFLIGKNNMVVGEFGFSLPAISRQFAAISHASIYATDV